MTIAINVRPMWSGAANVAYTASLYSQKIFNFSKPTLVTGNATSLSVLPEWRTLHVPSLDEMWTRGLSRFSLQKNFDNFFSMPLNARLISLAPDDILMQKSQDEFRYPYKDGESRKSLTQQWLNIIGSRLTMLKCSRAYRKSPFIKIGETFIVIFDRCTGKPLIIRYDTELPQSSQLGTRYAAIRLNCIEREGREIILPDINSIITGDAPITKEARAVIEAIAGLSPEMTNESNTTEALSDAEVDIWNRAFIEKTLREVPYVFVTTDWDIPFRIQGMELLTRWWTGQIDNASIAQISELLWWRIIGHPLYDISIDRHGRFIKASLHVDWGDSPYFTTHNIGIDPDKEASALNTLFHFFDDSSGKRIRVPVSYDLSVNQGTIYEAFMRWYDSEEYREARKFIVSQKKLSKIMFQDRDPLEQLERLLKYLEGLAREYRDLVEIHFRAWCLKEDPFPNFIDRLKSYVKRKETLSLREELEVAYLEMLVRQALGNERVRF